MVLKETGSVTCFVWALDIIHKLKLNVDTSERGPHMNVCLYRDDKKSAGLTFVLALQMLNQLSNQSHFLRQ